MARAEAGSVSAQGRPALWGGSFIEALGQLEKELSDEMALLGYSPKFVDRLLAELRRKQASEQGFARPLCGVIRVEGSNPFLSAISSFVLVRQRPRIGQLVQQTWETMHVSARLRSLQFALKLWTAL